MAGMTLPALRPLLMTAAKKGFDEQDLHPLKERKPFEQTAFTIFTAAASLLIFNISPSQYFWNRPMASFSNIRSNLSAMDALERQLYLKQLQINRLLNITQAINNNTKAEGLFEMYTSFLSWEMEVKKMMLFYREDGDDAWICAAHIGVPEALTRVDISDRLSVFKRLENLDHGNDPVLSHFDLVIPVHHKEEPLAYVFLGGFSGEDDTYNKVQFITTITNIIAVAIENKRLFNRKIEQERMNRDMELAAQIQRMLIPGSFPEGKEYEFASIYKPHRGVGGDYFDFVELDNSRIAFCVGDISGKGVAAGLLMANFQANFHSLIRAGTDLDVLIAALNESVLRITGGDRFITFFVAIYDVFTQRLRYVNAGHNPPALVMNDKVVQLDKGCTILGSFKDLPACEIGELTLDNEALILTYTDGLTDIRNDEGRFFDETFGHRFLLDHYRLNAESFNEQLLAAIEQFRGSQEYPDDLTVLTCKIC